MGKYLDLSAHATIDAKEILNTKGNRIIKTTPKIAMTQEEKLALLEQLKAKIFGFSNRMKKGQD